MKTKGITKRVKELNVSSQLQVFVQKAHKQLAHRLEKGFNRYSPKRQWLILFSFLLFCIGISTWVLVKSFIPPASPVVLLDAIQQPKVFPLKKSFPVLSPAEYDRFHAYRLHLDSGLQSGDTARAHQRDTLLLLEQFYLQQFKK